MVRQSPAWQQRAAGGAGRSARLDPHHIRRSCRSFRSTDPQSGGLAAAHAVIQRPSHRAFAVRAHHPCAEPAALLPQPPNRSFTAN